MARNYGNFNCSLFDRTQLTRRIKCSHPERSNEIALEITGKTIPDLLKGDSKSEVVRRCNEFFAEDGKDPESRCMVAHRASFDVAACRAVMLAIDLDKAD